MQQPAKRYEADQTEWDRIADAKEFQDHLIDRLC
jgi:hypothetical protein